jgi:hypothetical protein
MFENQLFDHWLQQQGEEIRAKIGKEKVSTEEMIILTLKAQTNNYHYMEVEIRDEFKKIDKKFDRIYKASMWGFGLILASIFALKIFVG